MSLKSQVTHGLKWNAITIVGRQLISFFVYTAIARLLLPSSYGLVGLVSVYLAFVTIFADQGIGTALVQRKDLTDEHLDTAFWFNLACALILCLGTIGGAGWVAQFYKEPKLVPLLRCASVGLVINALAAVHSARFTRNMEFKFLSLRLLLANMTGGLVGLGMAWYGFEGWALVGQQLAFSGTGCVFLWAASPYRPSYRFSLSRLKELFNVSSSILATSLLWFFSTRFDQIIIGRYAGTAALGFYTVGGRIPELANMITRDPVNAVTLPTLAKLRDDYAKLNRAVCRGMELNAYVTFAVFMGIAAVAPDLVPLLFGATWGPSILMCSLSAINSLVNAQQIFIYPALLASGGIGSYVAINILHTIGTVVACFIGIQYGITYLMGGLIINSVIIFIPTLSYLHRRTGLRPIDYCRPCFVPAMGALLMVGTVLLIQYLCPPLRGNLRLLMEILAGAAVYLGFTFAVKRSLWDEALGAVRHVLNKEKSKPTQSDCPV
jgi:PST family polysaccharide transporter